MTVQRGVRIVRGELEFARRIDPRGLPQVETLAAKQGLRYEKRVVRALAVYAHEHDYIMEHNPWFSFRDENGDGLCVPDVLLVPQDNSRPYLITEVKLTYTPAAHAKIEGLYRPVIEKALSCKCKGLTIAKHMIPGAPHGAYGLIEAMKQCEPVLNWLGYGSIPQ